MYYCNLEISEQEAENDKREKFAEKRISPVRLCSDSFLPYFFCLNFTSRPSTESAKPEPCDERL